MASHLSSLTHGSFFTVAGNLTTHFFSRENSVRIKICQWANIWWESQRNRVLLRQNSLYLQLNRQRLSYKESGLLANSSPSACQEQMLCYLAWWGSEEQERGQWAMVMTLPTHRSCSCLGPSALIFHVSDRSGHHSGKKKSGFKKMNEEEYVRLKKKQRWVWEIKKVKRFSVSLWDWGTFCQW